MTTKQLQNALNELAEISRQLQHGRKVSRPWVLYVFPDGSGRWINSDTGVGYSGDFEDAADLLEQLRKHGVE